jgi:hypothetical protein
MKCILKPFIEIKHVGIKHYLIFQKIPNYFKMHRFVAYEVENKIINFSQNSMFGL